MASASGPKRQPHGHLLNCPGGYRAFVPTPLPPPLAWDERLAVRLSAADRAIGRLAGEGRRLPNPHLLMRPFLRKEAVLSSRIEGTQATLGELLAAEAGAAVERSPGRSAGGGQLCNRPGVRPGTIGHVAVVAAPGARDARTADAGRSGRRGYTGGSSGAARTGSDHPGVR